MTETWDDVNEQVKAEWKDDTTPFERVYEIVEQTHDGQSAADIADRALVSEPTARRHCKALVNTGFAETEPDGHTTLYKRNSDRVLMSRIRELRTEVTRPELLDSIKEMKAEIRSSLISIDRNINFAGEPSIAQRWTSNQRRFSSHRVSDALSVSVSPVSARR